MSSQHTSLSTPTDGQPEDLTLQDIFPDLTNDEEPLKLLAVDDEPFILRALRRLTRHSNIQFLSAESGFEAMQILSHERIAVLISDQFMPEMCGVELLQHAQENYPECVRIMLTGNSDLTTAVDAINRGDVFRFVSKPWHNEDFLRTIDVALEQHRLLVSKRRYDEFMRRQNTSLCALNDELDRRVQERTADLQHSQRRIDALYHELQISFDATLQAMLSIMELGDVKIVDHCRRTRDRVLCYANAERLAEHTTKQLERAAMLHWIGLINAPSSMFSKLPDQYDFEEQAIWEFHPLLGQQTLSRIPALRRVGQILLHYLRPCRDDEFYPGALLDDDIIDEDLVTSCQILRVCSAYEHAQTALSRQGLRDAELFHDRAMAHLRQYTGTAFDPRHVRNLLLALNATRPEQRREQALPDLHDLRPGMSLSRPLESNSGVILAPGGLIITEELIDRLRRFEQSDGINTIYVWS
jgi:response regulator RpfG family c-di-GMP phosphodiesterase